MKAPFDHDRIVAKKVDALVIDLELDDTQKAQLLELEKECMNELRGKKQKQRENEKHSHTRKDKTEKNAMVAAKLEREADEKRHQQNVDKLLKPHQLKKIKARQTGNQPQRGKK